MLPGLTLFSSTFICILGLTKKILPLLFFSDQEQPIFSTNQNSFRGRKKLSLVAKAQKIHLKHFGTYTKARPSTLTIHNINWHNTFTVYPECVSNAYSPLKLTEKILTTETEMMSQNETVFQNRSIYRGVTSCHCRDHTRTFFIHHKRPVFIEDTTIRERERILS